MRRVHYVAIHAISRGELPCLFTMLLRVTLAPVVSFDELVDSVVVRLFWPRPSYDTYSSMAVSRSIEIQ
jgi:hypothetical protein